MRGIMCFALLLTGLPLWADWDWREFMTRDVEGSPGAYATSRLVEDDDDWSKYAEPNLFDRSKDTAWVEGASGDGIGEQVWFEVDPGITDLTITNGYARSDSLFRKNNRVKRLEATLWYGLSGEKMVTEIGRVYQAVPVYSAASLALTDTAKPQTLALPFDWNKAPIDDDAADHRYRADFKIPNDWFTHSRFILCLEIKEVYRGTSYRDTCIAEVSWTLPLRVAGPGRTRAAQLAGDWKTVSGAEWESLRLSIEMDDTLFDSYLHDRLYDSGHWYVGDGKLILESDAGQSWTYVSGSLTGDSLTLVSDDGREERYTRVPEE